MKNVICLHNVPAFDSGYKMADRLRAPRLWFTVCVSLRGGMFCRHTFLLNFEIQICLNVLSSYNSFALPLSFYCTDTAVLCRLCAAFRIAFHLALTLKQLRNSGMSNSCHSFQPRICIPSLSDLDSAALTDSGAWKHQ